ncbi:putative DNA-binding phage protein [Yersinia enterocolitica]|nr:putative DNA-binding phage protein [Yersinia enterocolitica]
MASSWIKVEVITPDKPEIFQLAEILNIDPDTVLGKLIRVWVWADQQTIDGNADGNAVSVTRIGIDRITFMSGFADALITVGWLKHDGGKMYFPDFDRHNGKGSKKRAVTSRRVTEFRDSKSKRNNKGNAGGVTPPDQKALPEEELEEEKELKENPPVPPKGKREGKTFDPLNIELPEWLPTELWEEWVQFRCDLKKPIKTKQGAMGAINQLAIFKENGHAPAVVIAQSIANEWQGLFEPKASQSHTGHLNIDFEGAFRRLVLKGNEPKNSAERRALKQAQNANLRMKNETIAHNAWRGYLKQAYTESGEQPYSGD